MRHKTKAISWKRPIKSIQFWLYNKPEKRTVVIDVLVIGETEKTVQVLYKEKTAWLQKSLIGLEQMHGDKVTISLPNWLFMRKFIEMKPSSRKI